MEKKQGFANVNGTKLYYESAGSGRSIFFIHGFGLDTRMWDNQFNEFSQHYHVIRYDLRGFGKSALPTSERYSHVEDLKALMDYLEIEHASIVGLSLGGRWAIQFAIDYKEMTNALIVADAMPNGYITDGEIPSSSREIKFLVQNKGLQAAQEAWFNHPIFKAARRSPQLSELIWQMISDYSGWHWANEDPIVIGDPPAAHRLSEIISPTLIIVGENDLDVFLSATDFLNQRIPNSFKVTIPEVGHMSNMESPSTFNNLIKTFINNMPK